MKKRNVFIIIFLLILAIGNAIYAKYILTRSFSIKISTAPFYFEAVPEKTEINIDGTKAEMNLIIKNNDGQNYNSYETEYEIGLVDNKKFNLKVNGENPTGKKIYGNSLINEELKITLIPKENITMNSRENVQIKVTSTKPYKKEILIAVDVLDLIKPTWKITSISTQTAKTTDTFSIRVTGTDNQPGVTSNLALNDINYLVNEKASSPMDKSLTLISSDKDEVVYELKVIMLGGSGNLKINISEGTLTDKSGNSNPNLTLDTGINMEKDKDIKILITKRSDWQNSDVNTFCNNVCNYYSNVTINQAFDVNNVLANNYNLVIFTYNYWSIPTGTNKLFESGVNLLTIGNDSVINLSISNSKEAYSVEGMTSIEVHKIVNNNLTKYLTDSVIETDSNILLEHYNSDVKVLYQSTYEGTNYDKVGYLRKNNTTWFHIGIPSFLGNGYIPIIEFIRGNLNE